tara:strand:- start:1113 stop:2384 length:1272 start_codon:yes stop_codon:yes gene_type:complete
MSQVNVDRIKSRAGTGSPTFTNGLVCSGVGTFSSHVSIAGTLTYEDVTNIDSVGIVTARIGIKALAGGANIVGITTSTLGLRASGGGLNVVGVGTFSGAVNVDDTTASTSTSTGALIVDGGVGIAKSLNVAGRTNVGGKVQFTVASPQLEFNNGGPRLWSPVANTLTFHSGGGFDSASNERLRITSTGGVGIGTTNVQGSGTLLHVSKGWNNSTVTQSSAINLLVSNNASAGDWSVLGFQAGNTGGSAIYFGDTDASNAGYLDYYHSDGRFVFGTNGAERLRITGTGGLHLTNGDLLERYGSYNSSAAFNGGEVNLDNGMVSYCNQNLSGANTINITSSVGINTSMAVGDMMAVTLITAVNADTAYINHITIDHSTAPSEYWVGGSAPASGDGGTSNVDIYTFNIMKNGSNAYIVIGNHIKTS